MEGVRGSSFSRGPAGGKAGVSLPRAKFSRFPLNVRFVLMNDLSSYLLSPRAPGQELVYGSWLAANYTGYGIN